MTKFSPLIIVNGQIENLGNRRCEIPRLNFGVAEELTVSGDFTISKTMVIATASSTVNVFNIFGGEEGDLLILRGNRVRLRVGGNLNIDSTYLLRPYRLIVFYFANSLWDELLRL